MNPTRRHLIALMAISLLILVTGCSGRDPASLETARASINPMVFHDDYDDDAYFQPFFETHYTAVTLDSVYAYNGFAPDGDRSLKVQIPPLDSALGPYTGGVITSSGSRDLSDFNALTFYARTDSGTATPLGVLLNEVGFGNDNTGTSLYNAGRSNLPMTWEWAFHVVPIPAPSKLISERGLFLLAESLQEEYRDGYNIWFDEIKFANLSNITDPRCILPSGTKQGFIGATVSLEGTRTYFNVDGAFMEVQHSPNYVDFVSDSTAVAVVEGSQIRIVGVGTAAITGTLEGVAANGRIAVTGYLAPPAAATPPNLPAEDVISMFSDVYNDVNVDTWDTNWGGSNAEVQDFVVNGDNTKMYTGLNFVGIEFLNPTIDASAMTHFHMDVYAPSGTNFRVKLVSFPPDLESGVETSDLTLTDTTTPDFTPGGWVSLDIPLVDFQVPEGWDWSQIGQLVLSTSNAQLVLVDNIYWRK